jgi:hypothetical protein
MFDKFPKYHTKIVLGNICPKVDKEDTLKPIIGIESLREILNDNGFTAINVAIFTVKSIMFQHRNFDKFTWTSSDGKTHNRADHILINRRRQESVLDSQSFRPADSDTDHYMVVAKVKERLAVSNRTSHRSHMDWFKL